MKTGRPISDDDLHAYVDNVLDADRHAQVEAHLRAHPDIAARVLELASQRAMLREALAPVALEPVPAALNLGRLIEARRRSASRAWRSAAGAVILLAAGGAAGWFGHALSPRASGGIAALAQEASDNYEVYGLDRARPVEIKAADSADLNRWVSLRLQHPIVAPDLAASGYRFMGGRLVTTPHGPAGMFMYDDDRGTRLVMLVRPMAIEKNAPMAPHASGRVAGFAWAQDGLGYSLVGPAAPEILHPLANEIRRQSAKDT